MIFVATHPEERPFKQTGSFFSFQGVSKHPRKEERCWYKVCIFVPSAELDHARQYVKQGQNLQIRMGELVGNKTENGTIFNEVKVSWAHIQPWRLAPEKGKDNV